MATVRFARTALHLENREQAVKDELLLNPSDGEIYYKRKDDGQVVSYDDIDYTKESIENAFAKLMEKSPFEMRADEYLAYYTLDISGNTNMLSTEIQPINIQNRFNISIPNPMFIFRVRGNKRINAIHQYVANRFEEKGTGEYPEIRVTLEILFTTATGTVPGTMVVEGNFDELIHVPISTVGAGVLTNLAISVKSITFPKFAMGYPYLTNTQREEISVLNNNNRIFEASKVDALTFIRSTDDILILNTSNNTKTKLLWLYPNTSLDIGGDAREQIVVSKEQPPHACIWMKINE